MRFYQRRVQIPVVVQSPALQLWERRRWFEAVPEDLGKLATTAPANSASQSARKNQLAWISQEVTASELMIAVLRIQTLSSYAECRYAGAQSNGVSLIASRYSSKICSIA